MTPKQEKFCQVYVETGNASEAYRQAYDAEKMKPQTINRKAHELIENGKIAARIEALMAAACERHEITMDSITSQLMQDRANAILFKQASPAVAATVAIAKLHGLIVDKREDVTNRRTVKEIDAAIDLLIRNAREGRASGSAGRAGHVDPGDATFPTVPGHGTA